MQALGFTGIKPPIYQPVLDIPEKLRTRKVKGERQRSKFTRDFLDHVTPQMACALAESLMRSVQQNNPQAQRIMGEMVQMVKTREGPHINLQQNNTSNTLTVADKEEKISFDQIIRIRDAERRKRLGQAPITVEATVAE